MKDNRGFASTFILFGLLTLFLIVMSVLLFTMNNSSVINSGIKVKIVDDLEKNENNYLNKEYTVTANINGGTAFATSSGWTESGANLTKKIEQYAQYGGLPEPYKTDYKFLGWYTQASGGTQITSDTLMTSNQNHTIYAHWSSKKVLCKRAKTLHTEECGYTDPSTQYYCYRSGYCTNSTCVHGTKTITYGNLGIGNMIYAGDAFDCDVNGDGTYDPVTERFYYVSDYFNPNIITSNKDANNNYIYGKFDGSYATLVYYNVITDASGTSLNYGSTNKDGPTTAKSKLPTSGSSGTWKNVTLKSTTRRILSSTSVAVNQSGSLKSNFSYSGKAARLLTEQELAVSCANKEKNEDASIDTCEFLLENTQWVNSGPQNLWLETASTNNTSARRIMVGHGTGVLSDNGVKNFEVTNNAAVKPAIDVSYDDILLTNYE